MELPLLGFYFGKKANKDDFKKKYHISIKKILVQFSLETLKMDFTESS